MAVAIGGLLGQAVTRIERLAGYVGNQDFMIYTDAGDYVLKAGHPGELAAEAWASDRVRQLDVPTPEVVALETEPHTLPSPLLLTRRLPGTALGKGDHPALVETGRHLRAVHSITLDGYGFLKQPSHDSWPAFVAEAPDCLDELAANGVLTEQLAERIAGTLDRCRSLVAYDKPGVLLHGDLKPPHIFIQNESLVGIIDWGDVLAGDPLYDIARFSLVGKAELDALLRGYELQLTAELAATLAVYRIVRMTTCLRDEFRNGGDWFATYRGSIERDLSLLAT